MRKYSVVKNGKYLKFICECGSEMWDNRFKKKSSLHSDLRCKNKKCPYGQNGYPNSVYLKDDEKEALKQNQIRKVTSSKSNKSFASSVKSNYVDSSNIPLSMQVAWAKDIAVCLAEAQKIKTVEEFTALYKDCLKATVDTLNSFVSSEDKKVSQSVTREVEDTSLVSDSIDVEEPEDAEEPKSSNDEIEFDCDDIDI